MTLVKFVMFVVLKILDNLVSMQNSLNAHNCRRNVQGRLQLQSSVQLFDRALVIKKFSFCAAHLNAFWHGNKTFRKGTSQHEIVPLLVVFQLPYSKYKCVKICFYPCRYQNQKFSLVSHSCRSRSTRVALVTHSCRTCVTIVSLVLHSDCIHVARVAFVSLESDTRVVNQTRPVLHKVFEIF